jgi:hypothetical protein
MGAKWTESHKRQLRDTNREFIKFMDESTLSAADVAKHIGVDETAVKRWLKGIPPNGTNANRIKVMMAGLRNPQASLPGVPVWPKPDAPGTMRQRLKGMVKQRPTAIRRGPGVYTLSKDGTTTVHGPSVKDARFGILAGQLYLLAHSGTYADFFGSARVLLNEFVTQGPVKLTK